MLSRLAAIAGVAVLAGGLPAGASWGRAAVDGPLCGTVVLTNLTLSGNLRCASKPGLVVGAPGITIDLHGFTIEGAAGNQGDDQTGIGIQNTGFDGVKIINGTIYDFRFGIVIEGDADKNLVEDVAVRSNHFDGLIVTTGSDQLTLKGVRAVDNGADGISLTDSTGHKVSASVATRNAASGFELINAPKVSISGSTATLNGSTGVLVTGASADVSISKTTVAATTGPGIFLDGDDVDGATLQDIVATGSDYAVYVSGGDGDVLQRVTASSNHFDGVVFEADADGGSLSQSTASGNRDAGVRVCGTCEVLITKTAAAGNEGGGIELGGALGVVKKSTADGNQGNGIHAVSTESDGGGNTAHGNTAADCVNVVCG